MHKPLSLLLVEDSEDDATLLLRELTKAGFSVQHSRVENAETLRDAFAKSKWDIVITDHNLPEFNSEEALKIIREWDEDIPVIIVSGSIGEDIAVAAMKSGAHDYIMKGNLTRLAPAIERELRDAQIRHEHRQARATIEHMAFHDALTGLANRFEFEHLLRTALETSALGHCHALLYIDLDQFKIINDTCGHIAGDELLRQITSQLKVPIRSADTLARLGGDEFGILLQDCTLAAAKRIADRMLELVRNFRFNWQGRSFSVGASIGLAMLDTPGLTLAEILRRADMACYAAKEQGRNRLQIYQPDSLELRRLHGEMEWVNRINQALERNQFEIFHQQIVPLSGNRTTHAYEILLRMRDMEENKLVLPESFIPAAERYGLMPALDRWVVSNCFSKLSSASNLILGNKPEMVFINLSGATLSDRDFLDLVKDLLRRYQLPPSSICFEITETAAIANLNHALYFIEGVKSIGCQVALDDFGAGLSSFSYLKTLPADFLKIDGAFIRDMLDDTMDKAIVEAINSIGHVAGLKTIAEFVESSAIQSRLVDIGVDYAQGYSIHRPEKLFLP